jgi:outer membrane protein assembly factor BamB
VTIKGTLETFNLLDLLQMLSFNQKVGTLVLETAEGPRTLFVEGGSFGFVQGDPQPSRVLARVLRRGDIVPTQRLERGLAITANSGRFLGDVLAELGVLDPERRNATWREGVEELFFDLLQTPITKFEFVEGKRLAPNGTEGEAIQPLRAVDGVLIELTRKLDEWSVLKRDVGGGDEVFELSTTPEGAVEAAREIDAAPQRIVPLLDGRRTLAAIVEASDWDRFTVAKCVGAMLKHGAAQPVPTEDLLSRAEEAIERGVPHEAIPLVRKAIERGGTPPTTRLRLAAALETSGEPAAAASELDTYATSESENDPEGAFDALRRALALRGGDGPTAARLCDHYLLRRSRLPGRGPDAAEALRRLVHAATSGGRPLEAAERLAAFLDAGETSSEDLLVLADLYAAGGRPSDAAQALVRRADDLLAEGREGPARDLLRRALGYDSTRVDARRRVADIEGQARKRRHTRRVTLLVMLLALVGLTAAGVYLIADGRAAKAVDEALARADGATKDAEARMRDAHAAWTAALASAATTAAIDETTLPAAAARLKAEGERAGGVLKSVLTQAASDLNNLGTTVRSGDGLARLQGLEARHRALLARVEGAWREATDRSDRALAAGERAFSEGRFREARPLLVQCMNLCLDAPERASRAKQRLEQVDAYTANFARARADFDAAAAAGDTDGAWRAGAGLLARFLDSDLARELLFPVPVDSDPAGAEVRLGSGPPGATPTTLRYSPFGETELRLRSPGRVPSSFRLPSYKEVLEAEKGAGSVPFRVDARLPEGPRWSTDAPGGVATGPFVVGEAVMVSADDGRRVMVVRPDDGELVDARALGRHRDRVRLAGRCPGGLWALEGQRTFALLAEGSGPGWQVQTVGRLDKPPAFAAGVAVLVDETGACYGVDLADGNVRWRASLPFGPTQAPYATTLGVVVTTLGGEAVALAPATGEVKALVPADPTAPAFLAPWRDGAVILGGSGPGLAFLSATRERTTLGNASPDLSVRPLSNADGISWVEKDGRARWLGRRGDGKPVVLFGLGQPATPVTVADGTAYAVGRDGVLRAARLDAPGATAWRSRVVGTPRGEVLSHGDVLYVATTTALKAFDR